MTTASIDLLGLAPELVENIISFLRPHDIIQFGRTCKLAASYLRPNNVTLWQAVFLQVFDDPKTARDKVLPESRISLQKREAEWSWHHELRKRYTARNLILKQDWDPLRHRYNDVVEAVLDIFDTAINLHIDDIEGSNDERTGNMAFLESLYPQLEGFIHDYHPDISSPWTKLESALADTSRPMTRSMVVHRNVSDAACRLHILYGPTRREQESRRGLGTARMLVYDWSERGALADYGPFKNDGSGTVNWHVLEGVSTLMHRNILAVDGKLPHGLRHSVPYLTPLDESIPEDWAGVHQAWTGTYAFMDYGDLFHYNAAHALVSRPNLDDYEEACGDLMQMDLHLNPDLKDDPRLQTSLPVGNDLPMLYFCGMSSSRGRSRPRIACRGTASLVPGGREVRWRFLISYAGADQWQLEGVQPGGLRSGAIFGVWSHCDHEENGPIGREKL
ncbi:hypothetical protein LTS18_005462 [Coniosporium uncinatum]|uniref:Uncharacterized protein n=1 Tax=Coniosporium uncinatum TaxID=93489 RepID=A0ACC3DRB1_9PEZI|nr:hypothetical protein LTS18_005462 [Coniosporium uncinatum]